MRTVIHHSADYDGIFCREIARHFLKGKDVKYIGWDFNDKPLEIPAEGTIYVMDLPVDRVFGLSFDKDGNNTILAEHKFLERVVWIDHHKTSIDTHPKNIVGYRVDGVAACRLAWQWFSLVCSTPHPEEFGLPDKQAFVERGVSEPYAVTLAGEYDIWDKHDPSAEVFQFGLRSWYKIDWEALLSGGGPDESPYIVGAMLEAGESALAYQRNQDAKTVASRSLFVNFEGLKFLALNTASGNSLTFAALDVPETGHDALMLFYWNGKDWSVSLYHANHRKGTDLSEIAKKRGGGGHRGACGFRVSTDSFISLILNNCA